MNTGKVTDINALTPVVRLGDYYFKREDTFAPFPFCSVNGSKLRQCMLLVQKNREQAEGGLVTATSLLSPQAAIVSAVARDMGAPCTIMYGGTTPARLASLPYPRICLDNGARVQIVAATGRTSAINAKAAEYVRNNGGYLIRYGFDMRGNADCFLQSVAQQVQNIPDNLDNLVVTIGSAITIVGILYGLALYGKRVRNIYGVGVAPNREEKIREYAGMLPHGVDLSALRYIDAFNTLRGFHYEDTFDIAYRGIRLRPRYEAKAFRWMLANKLGEGTLFWITGGELTKRTI